VPSSRGRYADTTETKRGGTGDDSPSLKEGFQAMEVGNFDEWFEKTYPDKGKEPDLTDTNSNSKP
jgi:hypothetical protein